MSEKIDVLEVFGKMRSNSYCWDFAQKDAAYAADQSAIADDAIAAVAELIEAADQLRKAEWMVTHDWGGDRLSVINRMDAALARIGAA